MLNNDCHLQLDLEYLSQHLALLREAEFVATRRSGQTIYYRLADNRIIQIINLLYGFFCADD